MLAASLGGPAPVTGSKLAVSLKSGDLSILKDHQRAKREGRPVPLKGRRGASTPTLPRVSPAGHNARRPGTSMDTTKSTLRARILTPTRTPTSQASQSRPVSSFEAGPAPTLAANSEEGGFPAPEIPAYKVAEGVEGPVPTQQEVESALYHAPFASSPRAFAYPKKWTGLPLYSNHLIKKQEKRELDEQAKMWKVLETYHKKEQRDNLIKQRLEEQQRWQEVQKQRKADREIEKKKDLENLMSKTNFYQTAADAERVKIVEKKAKERQERRTELETKQRRTFLMNKLMANQEQFQRDLNDTYYVFETAKIKLFDQTKKRMEWMRCTNALNASMNAHKETMERERREKRVEREVCWAHCTLEELEKRQLRDKRKRYGAELRTTIVAHEIDREKERLQNVADKKNAAEVRAKAYRVYVDNRDRHHVPPTSTGADGALLQENGTQTQLIR
eukprot:TRINITY_DN21614_c0_g1_i1.p1 TRINITY_DN21614_c0_g1~~TRINITY_DN21614_c0_g1_i1.p1  ORF type:complete len:447 (-),score=49.31 TRINITY_DN21614_c0_g1_i1:47-1387(-)